MEAVDIHDVVIADGCRRFITSAGKLRIGLFNGSYRFVTMDNKICRARLPDRHVISAVNAAGEVSDWLRQLG